MSETNDTVLFDQHNAVVTLTINRPDVRNAFNPDVIERLIDSLNRIEADETVRAVIIKGGGDHFSAGADLNWMKATASYSEEENLKDAKTIALLMSTLNYLNKTTICIVSGSVFGGAVGLVACCDLVIAEQDAKFCLSEVKLGLSPAVISPYIIKAIGENYARRWMLTAEVFTSKEAYHMGLVHKVIEKSELESASQHYSNLICQNGPKAMAATKALISYVVQGPTDDRLDTMTAKVIAGLRASEEGQEGLTSFLEKRKPDWAT